MKFPSCATQTGALGTVTAATCMTILRQARRLAWQKVQSTPSFSTSNIVTQATWSTPLAATDDTKIIVPEAKFFNPAFNGTEAQYVGNNDNSTPEGRRIVVNTTVPSFSGQLAGLNGDQFEELENLFAWANKSMDFDVIWVYPLLGDKQILCYANGAGIPISAAFIADPTGGQLNELTYFNIGFDLPKGWYRGLKILDLSFNHALLKN